MAQYLNPYEGIGNALINIGQNYDLDRRRKREAEEDQKRRRADYLWQSKQEEERANREYERDTPKREMEMRIKLAELSKKQADAVTSTLQAKAGRVVNLPGGGGSIRQTVDDNGNLVEERLPYVPAPERERQTNWQRAYDAEGNVVFVDPNNPDNRRATDLRGTAPPSTEPTAYQKQQRAQSRLAALQRVESLSNEQIAGSIGVSKRDTAAISAERARRRKMVEDTYADTSEAATAATPASRSFGATAIDSIGQGLMKLGNAVTTTEADIAAGIAEGTIEPKRGAAMLAAMSGGDVSVNLGGNEAKAPAPKAKEQDITKTPEFKAEKAKLKKQYKDASDAEIEQYLLETWGK